MVVTLNFQRTGRDWQNPVRRELLKSESAQRFVGDTMLEAVLALRDQLSSRNEQIVAGAANSILELERTRLRHDQHVSGTHADVAQDMPELTLRPVESAILPDEDATPPTEHVDEIREHMERVVGRPMGAAEAKAYVEAKLGRWQVRANPIHRGEFVKMLRLMNDMPGANGSEFRDSRQSCGSGWRRAARSRHGHAGLTANGSWSEYRTHPHVLQPWEADLQPMALTAVRAAAANSRAKKNLRIGIPSLETGNGHFSHRGDHRSGSGKC